MGNAPKFVHVEGHPYMRDYQAEQVKVPSTAGWPMAECIGSGVHASQARELRDFHKKHGINVQVTNDGNPVYENAQQRKRVLKARGLHDKN